jgi:hypothetical protein
MITWFDRWNGCVHCSMYKCSRIIASLLKHIHMWHWRACHHFLNLCQMDWMFHLLMNVVKVHEMLPYHILFMLWIVVLCFGKMLVKPCRTLETNGETSLMPKLSIVFPMMFLTFLTNTMITNVMNFPQYMT